MITRFHTMVEETDTTEPVSLQEVKDWASIDYEDHDLLLLDMITGARQDIEKMLNLALVPVTVTLEVDASGNYDWVDLPYAKSVATVVVTDMDNEEILAADEYTLRKNRLKLGYKGSYSLTYDITPEPEASILEAIKMLVAFRYANRGDGQTEGIPADIKNKVSKYAIPCL